MPIYVRDLVEAIGGVAPFDLAESWDNVGLLVGDPASPLDGPVLLTIDLTDAVVREAEAMSAGAVIAYHPPIFKPIARIGPGAAKGRLLLRTIEAGVAVISPHTALDAAPGGVADWLLDLAMTSEGDAGGGLDRAALAPHAGGEPSRSLKLVTFVPLEPSGLVDEVIGALAKAGAGRIGSYSHCSFAVEGRGSFLGGAGASPAVGEAGRLERVAEARVEMVCGARELSAVVETLRRVHPYEEPAFDVLALTPSPEPGVGAGRAATLERPLPLRELAARVKAGLGVRTVRVADASEQPVNRVGVCPGSGASLARAAVEAGCQAFVTGEMSHHEVLAAMDAGLSVILAGHTNTERGYLPRLADLIRARRGDVDLRISAEDRWPLTEL